MPDTTTPGSSPLSLTVTHPAPRVAVLALAGELDSATAPRAEESVQHLLAGSLPPTDLVIDVADLTFVSSAGIAVLIRARTELGCPRGGPPEHRLHLTGAERSRAVRRVMQLTGLGGFFHTYPTLDEGLRDLLAT